MPTTPLVLASAQRYSEHCLPSRRWSRVLVVGSDAADVAVLLAEHGYDVAVRGADDAEHQLAFVGVDAVDVGGELDAVVVAARAPDVLDVVRDVRARLRAGGLVLAAAGVSASRRELRRLGFALTDELGVPALRRLGTVGRVVRAVV